MLSKEYLEKAIAKNVERNNEVAINGVALGKVSDEVGKVIAALATGSLTVEALRNGVPVAPAPAPAPTKSAASKTTSKKSGGKKPFDTSKLKDVVLEWGEVTKQASGKGYYVTFGNLKRDCYAVIARKVELAGGKYDPAVKGFAFNTKKATEAFIADNKVVSAAERKVISDEWEARRAAKEA